MKKWKTLSSEVVSKNPWFTLRKDDVIRPNGTKGSYYVIDKPSVVVIVPLTEKGDVYLIRTNRYTTKKTNWEVPAGSSDGENELFAAKRELMEETGLKAKGWTKLGETEVAPGMMSQIAHNFLAYDLTETGDNKQLEENIDKMQKFPFKKVLEMIEKNEIVDGLTITAIMLASLKINK